VIPEAITEPCLIDDVPDATYHSGGVRTPGPQVSQSGLKQLRPPWTPRDFQWYLLHGLPPSRALDKGRAAHTIALGRGEEFTRHPDDYLSKSGAMNSTKESSAWLIAERAAGRTPLSAADYAAVFAMAEELLLHPRAGELLTDPARRPEVSAFHEATPGLWMRSRFDLMGGHLVDLKTSKDPRPGAWLRQAWSLGYHVQDVSYRRAFAAVTGAPDPGPMEFIVVENKAPFLVGVYTLDADFERLGAEHVDAALALYAAQFAKHGDPRADGVRWDGLPTEVAVLSPPRYAFYDAEGVEYEPEF